MKQETLEAAALKKYDYSLFINEEKRPAFIEGAKWQQERSYSEEEVWNMCNELASYFIGGDTFDLKEWFKQFKKK